MSWTFLDQALICLTDALTSECHPETFRHYVFRSVVVPRHSETLRRLHSTGLYRQTGDPRPDYQGTEFEG